MNWCDCYEQEGRLFRNIEVCCRINKKLYERGYITLEKYELFKTRYKVLLYRLEDAFTSIYEKEIK